VWRHITIIPALGRLRQEGTARPAWAIDSVNLSQKKKKKKKYTKNSLKKLT
jgi:hypothetical protein